MDYNVWEILEARSPVPVPQKFEVTETIALEAVAENFTIHLIPR